jgi:two-component system, cell cycle response regulator
VAERRGPAKRWAAQSALPLAIAACAVLLVCGAYLPTGGPLLRQTLSWALLVAAGLAACARQIRFTLRGTGARPPRPWAVEAALLLAVGALALTQLTGAAQSPLSPLIYLLGAGYVLALPLPVAAALIVALIGLDASLIATSPPLLPLALSLRERWPLAASHGGFTVLFAGLYHGLLFARMRRADRAERDAVSRRVAEAEQRALEMRLVVTSDTSGDEREEQGASSTTAGERQLLSAVAEVEEALCGALAIAQAALKPHTAAVFLLSPGGETVRLRECLSKSDRLLRGPLSSREGALGAVLLAGRPVRLGGDGPALAYYEGTAPAAAFCGVPLRESARAGRGAEAETDPLFADVGFRSDPRDGTVFGALIADRAEPFSEDDERVLVALAAEVVRAIEAERLFGSVRREKEEKARFFTALQQLNGAKSLSEAAEKSVDNALRMCPGLDLCAVTLAEEPVPEEPAQSRKRGSAGRSRLRHRVVKAAGRKGSAALEGLSFADNDFLVSSVVRLGVPLPGRDLGAMDHAIVFDRPTSVRGLAALKIFPLRAGDETIGTLVCGSGSKQGLPAKSLRELSMLALQAAAALSRTRLLERAEKLATTDGLTGLLNRRTLQAQLTARMREAQRYRHPLSFLLIDIDHFKKVNDTHGHPAGDAVLRGVAAIAQDQARETDLVARYGGEEMALILPETEAAGAWVIADRLRAAVEAAQHPTDAGPLRCTVSVGVSTWMLSAGAASADDEVAALIEGADKALYRAKRAGRNRVESAGGREAA